MRKTANIPDDKVVLITGASTGIGRACVLKLAGMGRTIYAGVRKEADGRSLLDAAGAGQVVPLIIDVTKPDTIAAAREHVVKAGAGLWGLVNNAGIAVGGVLELVPIERVQKQLDVNVLGALRMIQAFTSLLRETRGRIVNVSSISGRIAAPCIGPYAASKFALEALSDSLRLELRPQGIQVSLIEPGAVTTPIWDKARANAEGALERLGEEGRAIYGEDVTRMAALVAKSEAQAVDVSEVTKVVVHALTAKRARTRYLVGREAKIGAWVARWMPTRLRDFLFDRNLRGRKG